MNDDIHLLTGAYAVDALTPEERATFEAHLNDCPDCTLEVRELTSTAARLGSADSTNPPRGLRKSVLAAIELTPQVVPESHDAHVEQSVAQSGPRRYRVVGWLGAAAAVLAVSTVGLGMISAKQNQDINQLAAQTSMVTSVLTSPDAHVIPLQMASAGESSVVMSPTSGHAVLVANKLTSPPAHMTYQSWTMTRSGQAQSAGTWTPGKNGNAAVPLQSSMTNTAAVEITIEPMGGSAAPTSAPIAKATMPG